MDTLQFISRMGIARLGKLDNAIASALAEFDPETATGVDINKLIEKSHELAAEMVKHHEFEQRDAAIVSDLQSKLKKTQMAAQIIGDRLEAAQKAGSPTADLLASLMRRNEEITALAGEEGDGSKSGELFTAIQNHNQSAAEYAEWQHLHDDAVAKLSTAKQRGERQMRDMEQAKMQAERARQRQAMAEHEAGLREDKGIGDGVGLAAMERATQKARREAEAANIEADALSKVTGSSSSAEVDQILRDAAPAPVAEDALARMRRLTGNSLRPT